MKAITQVFYYNFVEGALTAVKVRLCFACPSRITRSQDFFIIYSYFNIITTIYQFRLPISQFSYQQIHSSYANYNLNKQL